MKYNSNVNNKYLPIRINKKYMVKVFDMILCTNISLSKQIVSMVVVVDIRQIRVSFSQKIWKR